jgi:hypothetical protein
MGPECQFLGLTAPRPHRPLSDSSRQCLARAHGLGAVVLPPTISTPPRCRRPPPLAAVKGATPTVEHPFFLLRLPPPPHYASIPTTTEPSWTACSGLPSTDSTMPRAPRRCVQPPRTTSCRPPPPDAVPTAVPLRPTRPHHRVHSSGELFPLAAPKWVHHPTALLPGPSPLDLVAKRRQNPAGPPPAPPWPRSLPCLTKMGHQPKWLGQSEAGRPVSARLHSAACHFSMRLKID